MSFPWQQVMMQQLKKKAHHPAILETLEWAVFPAGKLFRPRLLEAALKDLSAPELETNLKAQSWGMALEFHHAYSLVHDDLPCMDNDDMRRGKPSTHKQYGEWKALLAGDALLVLSVEMAAQTGMLPLVRWMRWATGPKGLILGQWMDLGLDQNIIRIHELKTARLMQLALIGAQFFAEKTSLSDLKTALRLGQSIGVSFQLIDDLDDFLQHSGGHEAEINPFHQNPDLAKKRLVQELQKIQKYPGPNLRSYLEHYLKAQQSVLKSGGISF